jgi:hypothetical protein
MPSDSVPAEESDPLKAVADAMDAAVEAAKEGAGRARSTAAEALPAAGELLSQVVYKTSYAVAFGVVLPAAMLARAIPKNNAAVNGIVDGARAAMDAIAGKTAEVPSEPAP